jgi:hypothetical protein
VLCGTGPRRLSECMSKWTIPSQSARSKFRAAGMPPRQLGPTKSRPALALQYQCLAICSTEGHHFQVRFSTRSCRAREISPWQLIFSLLSPILCTSHFSACPLPPSEKEAGRLQFRANYFTHLDFQSLWRSKSLSVYKGIMTPMLFQITDQDLRLSLHCPEQ